MNSGLFIYTYDANGNEVESLEKGWWSSTWNGYRKIISQYNASNQKFLWLQQRYTSEWENEERVFYSYDTNENMNYAYHEVRYQTTGTWNKEDGNILFEDNSGAKFALWSSEIDVLYNELTDVNEYSTPKLSELAQNYPNPFNPSTTIQFALPKTGLVSLKVYNILGEEVATLINGEMNAGYQSMVFDASKLASGLYFYRLQSGDFTDVKKMMLLK